jgi:hypothetical protein
MKKLFNLFHHLRVKLLFFISLLLQIILLQSFLLLNMSTEELSELKCKWCVYKWCTVYYEVMQGWRTELLSLRQPVSGYAYHRLQP